MGTVLKPPKLQHGNGERTRVAVKVPITISAKDKSGRSFKEDSHTIVISKLGVKLVTTHELPIGTEIAIQNQENGRVSKGYVVWAADWHSSSEPNEVGVYLPDGEFLWEIDLPAENAGNSGNGLTKPVSELPDEPVTPATGGPSQANALRPPIAAEAGTAPADSSVAAAHPASPAGLEGEWAPGPVEPAAAAPVVAPAVHPVNLNSALEAALKSFTQKASDAAEGLSRGFEQKLSRLAEQVVARTQSSFEDSSSRLDKDVVESKVREFGEKLADVTEIMVARVQSNLLAAARQAEESATEAQTKHLKENLTKVAESIMAETQVNLEGAREQMQSTLMAVARQAEESAAEAQSEHLQASLQKIAASILAQTQANLEGATAHLEETVSQSYAKAGEVSGRLESTQAEADKVISRLESLSQQGQAELEKAQEGFRELSRQSAEFAAQEINRRVTEQGEEQSKHLDESLRKIAASILAETQANLEGATAHLEEMVSQSYQKAREVTGRLESTQAEAGKVISRLESLSQQGQTELEKAQEGFRELSQQSVEFAAQELNRRVNQQMEPLIANLVEHTHDRLRTEVSDAVNNQIEGEFLGRLQRTLNEFQGTGCLELATHLQEAFERQREALVDRLNKDSEEMVSKTLVQLQTRSEQVLDEVFNAVNKRLTAVDVMMRERAEEVLSRIDPLLHEKIEGSSRAPLEEFRKRVDDLSVDLLASVKEESESLAKGFRSRLEKESKTFESESIETVMSKLQQITEELVGDSSAQLHHVSERNLSFVTNLLAQAQKRVVTETSDAFRAKIAELLSSLQSGLGVSQPAQPAEENEPARPFPQIKGLKDLGLEDDDAVGSSSSRNVR